MPTISTREPAQVAAEFALGIERMFVEALSAAAERQVVRIAMIDAVAEMQSALGRLKAALAETAQRLGIEQ